MALQIWLPLDGTLENKGCADITVVNNGATVDTAGKIGSCYSFDGSNDSLLGTPAVLNNSSPEWSFACWFKPTNSHQGCLFSNRTRVETTGITIFYYQNQMIIDDGSRWQFTPSQAISVGEWNHITVTKSQQNKKFYLNGVLINSTTSVGTPTIANATSFSIGASQQSSTVASGNQLNGQLNDVRVYDHCLSATEVKELSQGLVLHYKLDSIALDGKTIVDSSGYGHHGTAINTIGYSDDSPKYTLSCNLTASSSYIIGNYFASEFITFSLWVKFTTLKASHIIDARTSDSGYQPFYYNGTNSTPYIQCGGTNGYPNFKYTFETNRWYYVCIRYDSSSVKCYVDGIQVGTSSSGKGTALNAVYSFYLATRFNQANYSDVYISDFRIYCTALSAEDILDLYHTSAKIDKTGKVHTFEFVEDEGTKIMKTGITKWVELIEETGNAKFNSQYILANDFIER